jgi:stage II sporulation protein P
MTMKAGQGISWRRVLRRVCALFFATVALWLLWLTCDFGAAWERLGESSAFLVAALRAQLGEETWSDSPWSALSSCQRLALGQSALLRAGSLNVQQQTSAQSAQTQPEPAQGEEGEEQAETQPQTTAAPDSIQERTLLSADSEGYLSAMGVSLFNYTSQDLDVETLAAATVGVELQEDGPQILIMHTHTTESYTMDGADVYTESDAYRTTDERYNMLRIGDEMQQVFEDMGLTVIHDRTLYDYPQYSGAYTRSRAGVEAWLEQYPSIQVVLDVHRDALTGDDGTVYKAVTQADGEKTAQVLMIVGTDDQGQEHPYWRQNLALAVQIQQRLDESWPTLARPITLRSSRFNQQLTRGSLLVEVGSHGNTLQESLRAARLFAQAVAETLLTLRASQ